MSAAPRARWGFHRLRDSYARRLVNAAGVGPGDLVIDIGAGTGALTARLLATGATVLAVELHPARAAGLRERFHATDCHIICADATRFRFPERPFRVVANPPFAAIATILRQLTTPHSRLIRADLIVPSYVAGRWRNGRAPVAAYQRFAVRVAARIPPHAFNPPAPAGAAHLVIERLR